MNEIEQLQKMIDESNNIVFFGGAGVSTESGVKDFRSKDGLYNMKLSYPVEMMLSSEMFYTHPKEFYEFYKKYMNCLNIEPNITHKFLKKLEDQNKLKAIVTQNIDGLHQKAGSKNVLEIHGTTYKNHCLKCNKEYSAEYVFHANGIPMCECGGMIKPDVVLYGEMLPESYSVAQNYIYKAELLIVAGTSLTVEPAASLIKLFHGKHLVIINKDKTNYDNCAELVINKSLKDVFSKLK
jgi:NAD-dependent deacetylase